MSTTPEKNEHPAPADVLSVDDRLAALPRMLEGLIRGDDLDLTKACNATALIYEQIGQVNWCGFYFLKGDALLLGPFQGKPACTRIQLGRGVCGSAAQRRETVLVEDVHQFAGHVACDAASNSEIVVPLIKGGQLWGVLDLDSEDFGRFTERERRCLERLAEVLNQYIDWWKIV